MADIRADRDILYGLMYHDEKQRQLIQRYCLYICQKICTRPVESRFGNVYVCKESECPYEICLRTSPPLAWYNGKGVFARYLRKPDTERTGNVEQAEGQKKNV